MVKSLTLIHKTLNVYILLLSELLQEIFSRGTFVQLRKGHPLKNCL